MACLLFALKKCFSLLSIFTLCMDEGRTAAAANDDAATVHFLAKMGHCTVVRRKECVCQIFDS